MHFYDMWLPSYASLSLKKILLSIDSEDALSMYSSNFLWYLTYSMCCCEGISNTLKELIFLDVDTHI